VKYIWVFATRRKLAIICTPYVTPAILVLDKMVCGNVKVHYGEMGRLEGIVTDTIPPCIERALYCHQRRESGRHYRYIKFSSIEMRSSSTSHHLKLDQHQSRSMPKIHICREGWMERKLWGNITTSDNPLQTFPLSELCELYCVL